LAIVYVFEDIFWALNGDTCNPLSENILQNAVTRVLLPEPEEVP
jgi:hypothetical protein